MSKKKKLSKNYILRGYMKIIKNLRYSKNNYFKCFFENRDVDNT